MLHRSWLLLFVFPFEFSRQQEAFYVEYCCTDVANISQQNGNVNMSQFKTGSLWFRMHCTN